MSREVRVSVASSEGRAAPVQPDVLRCINRRFEEIARKLRIAFYTVACVSFVMGLMSTLRHSEDSSVTSAAGADSDAWGIAFGTAKSVLSNVLVIVPIQAVAAECQRAFDIGSHYEFSGEPIPPRVIRFLSQTRTLCFSHPFSDLRCRDLADLADPADPPHSNYWSGWFGV